MMPAASVVLLGGTIFGSPREEPIRDGVVIIQDGRIAAVGARGSIAIPPGVPSLDCSGLSIAAGFWNSHVHFFERKWANAGEIPAAELARQL
ncbi:MAG TPA: amidohydrolase, partial [Vicinamibacteria bacterium]